MEVDEEVNEKEWDNEGKQSYTEKEQKLLLEKQKN